MTLKKTHRVFAAGFRVLSVDRYDNAREVNVNTNMYIGEVQGIRVFFNAPGFTCVDISNMLKELHKCSAKFNADKSIRY